MDEDSAPSPNEFSRIVALEAHRERPVSFTILASLSECAALARRFDLVRLDKLSGAGELRARPGGGWRLAAKLEAKLAQSCVISLREIPVTIIDEFELDFSPAVSPDDEGDVDVADNAAEPCPRDGRLDVGEVVAQQLSLAQRSAAILQPKIDAICQTLLAGEEDRPRLEELRWRAGYDLALGRALAVKARTDGYNVMLAEAKQVLAAYLFASPSCDHD